MATPANAAITTPATNLPAQAPAAPKTFREMVTSEGYKKQLAAALPKGLSAERMVRVVLTAINRTPKLLNCTKESLWQSVLDCAALGLFPDPLGRAYLVPYGDKCQLIVGYKGLVDLAYRSGMVESIQSRCVYDGDTFIHRYGMNPDLQHVPCSNPGNLVAVYSVIHIKGSSMATFDVMSMADVEKIRARSRAKDSGPWQTDYDEMAKKTVLRRHMKMQPMATEEVSKALEYDGADDALGTAASDAINRDRLKDDFGSEKPAESTVVPDAAITAAIKDANHYGVPGDTILQILDKAGGGPAGSIEERAAKVSADKLATCISDLQVVTRVYAEGDTK